MGTEGTFGPRSELVLVADDEPSLSKLVSNRLRERGFRVIVAGDGDEAWCLAHEHAPDLAILDVMMPGMSGWEVCRRIRETLSLCNTGVLILSGIGENLNRMTSPLYGADAHMDKPFDFAELERVIEEVLERRKPPGLGETEEGEPPFHEGGPLSSRADRREFNKKGGTEGPHRQTRAPTTRATQTSKPKPRAPGLTPKRPRAVVSREHQEAVAAPRVFISYSHDSVSHRKRVLRLTQDLRRDGVDAWVDQFETAPAAGWPRWMRQQLEDADFVLLVCTPGYRRKFDGRAGGGANWEGFVTEQLLFDDDARNLRFVPVVFDSRRFVRRMVVPLSLRSTTCYALPEDYSELLRRLRLQPIARPRSVGELMAASPESTADDPELCQLREEQKRLTVEGHDTADIDDRILCRRRQLRDSDDIGQGSRLADGRFELVEEIGQGGFGTVWKAWDHEARRLVAAKTLHAQFRGNPSRRARFFRGARIMAGLRHRGIVGMVSVGGEKGDPPFFVMEYVSGGDLRQIVLGSDWKPKKTSQLLCEVAEAVRCAHRQRLVHRDIKPANILLTDSGDPKLTDFDLVRAADTTGGTRTGPMGTFLYTAPESLQSAKTADARADIFSLGMVGLFCLHGRELPADAWFDPWKFASGLRSSPRLRQVLVKACARDPAARFPTADALLNALKALER